MRVALTFDAEHPDRPSEHGIQERVLDRLGELGVRASFFLQGRWVEAYPETARRVPAEGHLVGSHSFYHARMPLLSAAGFETDVRAAERVICDVLGVDPRPWFRLPFGTGSGDAAIHGRLEALGYRHVHWHVNAEEWRPEATAREVEDAIVTGTVARGDGAVVLLHAWPVLALAVLDGVVARLRQAGAEFVRLDELDAWPAGEA